MMSTVVCDLDGVVYLGDQPTPGARQALFALQEAGHSLAFATNNSAREPEVVVQKLKRVVGYEADVGQIVTSSLVAASLITDGPVLTMGESGVDAAVTGAGFALTTDPLEAKTVVVGLDRHLSYERVTRAAAAARRGARLIVTNRDPTFPTDRGLFPGAGACAAAVETAAGVTGVTAGKPSEAMRTLIERTYPDGPIWMVGDRPDTDIALANGPRWRSILVLTGVTTAADDAEPVADHVAADLASAARLILANAPLSPGGTRS